jgi:hypothetical protein
MTKVHITGGGHTVEIEGDGSIVEVAAEARRLWRKTLDAKALDNEHGIGFAQAPAGRHT